MGVLRFKITEQGVCVRVCRERVCVWGVCRESVCVTVQGEGVCGGGVGLSVLVLLYDVISCGRLR